MTTLSRRMQILLVALLAILTVALVAYAVRSGGTSRPESGGSSGSDPVSSTSVSPPVPTMLVIGDSAAAGSGASTESTSWVGRVTTGTGWTVVNRSVKGAGYVGRTNGVGSCTRAQCPSFATLLKRSKRQQVDVVLVAGGRDDALVSTGVGGDTRSFFAAIRKAFPKAKIVALDPSYDILNSASAALTADVRAAVKRVKGQYADIGRPLADHAERVAEGGTSPNDLGHRAIARAVLAQLRNAKVD